MKIVNNVNINTESSIVPLLIYIIETDSVLLKMFLLSVLGYVLFKNKA